MFIAFAGYGKLFARDENHTLTKCLDGKDNEKEMIDMFGHRHYCGFGRPGMMPPPPPPVRIHVRPHRGCGCGCLPVTLLPIIFILLLWWMR